MTEIKKSNNWKTLVNTKYIPPIVAIDEANKKIIDKIKKRQEEEIQKKRRGKGVREFVHQEKEEISSDSDSESDQESFLEDFFFPFVKSSDLVCENDNKQT